MSYNTHMHTHGDPVTSHICSSDVKTLMCCQTNDYTHLKSADVNVECSTQVAHCKYIMCYIHIYICELKIATHKCVCDCWLHKLIKDISTKRNDTRCILLSWEDIHLTVFSSVNPHTLLIILPPPRVRVREVQCGAQIGSQNVYIHDY